MRCITRRLGTVTAPGRAPTEPAERSSSNWAHPSRRNLSLQRLITQNADGKSHGFDNEWSNLTLRCKLQQDKYG